MMSGRFAALAGFFVFASVLVTTCWSGEAITNSDSRGFSSYDPGMKVSELKAWAQSTPEELFASFIRCIVQGRWYGQYGLKGRKVSQPEKFVSRPLSSLEGERKMGMLIRRVFVFDGEVALVAATRPGEDGDSVGEVSLRYAVYSDGGWYNNGSFSLPGPLEQALRSAEDDFHRQAPVMAGMFRHERCILEKPLCTSRELADSVKRAGSPPLEYVLSKLGGNDLVIFGETHFKAHNWNFMTKLVLDSRFPQVAGTIFLELSADRQQDMDNFLAAPKPDPTLFMAALQNELTQGWPDRGVHDFLLALHRVNSNLPASQRIRVILADMEKPYSSMKTGEEFNKYFKDHGGWAGRDRIMAEKLRLGLSSAGDSRAALYVVGYTHASLLGLCAAAELKAEQKGLRIHSIITHGDRSDNQASFSELRRQGLIDRAFALLGNEPAAFDLKDTPLGREPFDATSAIYLTRQGFGNYGDHYSGYLFLLPLEKEKYTELLESMFTPDFIVEWARRSEVFERTDLRKLLKSHTGSDDLTRENVVEYYRRAGRFRGHYGGLVFPDGVTRPDIQPDIKTESER